MIKRVLAMASLAWLPLAAQAFDVDGLSIPDQQTVFGQELALNGAGTRTAMGARIYLAALYLPSKSQSADVAISQPQPRRMMLVFRRSVPARIVVATLRDGIRQNAVADELPALQPALVQLESSLNDIYETRPGDRMALDIAADGSVRVFYNGVPSGELAGPAIGPAMLKIWLGKSPANAALKNQLLAGAQYASLGKERVSAFDSIFEGYSP